MIVEARGLVKRYGDLEAVAGLDFEVRSGEFFGLLGPNGAGKSTTMRMIYRVTPPTSGTLRVFGIEAGRGDREVKAQLGVVPQMDNLDEDLTVRENLLMYARFNDLDRKVAAQRADEMLHFVELSSRAGSKIAALSGGMKRRLTLARGLMNTPRLLILDEPTTGLDPQVRLSIWDKLGDLRAQGVTLLMSTHYMDEAERLCDRLIIMDAGRIVAEGSPRDLIRQHAAKEVVEMRGDPEALQEAVRALGLPGHRSSDRLSVPTDDGAALLDRLSHELLKPETAYVRPGNLEDVFLSLTGHSLRE